MHRATLLSPDSDILMQKLVGEIRDHIARAGFSVTRNEVTGLFDVAYHRFYERGKEFGYTAAFVLSASDASVHTYPEKEFDSTFELEFNLCYLKEGIQERHELALRRSIRLFSRWVGARKVVVNEYASRFF